MKLAPGIPIEASLHFRDGQAEVPAGRLAMAGGLGQLEWAPEIIEAKLPVSALLYPPEAGLYAARSHEFEGLHGFLADSLPEGWGYIVMRKRLAKLGLRIEQLTALDKLAIVGTEGRGALTYKPSIAAAPEVESLDLDELAAQSLALLEGAEVDLSDTLAALAGGSGGARPKVNVGFDRSGAISVADGEVADGHEAWIVKFAAPTDPMDIGPIEAAYAEMARASGIAMATYRMLPSRKGPGYFATRRFDRPAPGERLHMVSLSGAIEASSRIPSSYDMFLRATMAITRHAEDLKEVFMRMIFNILASNRDDHTRQHSYLMDARGEWRLSPAYDLTYAAGPGGEHYLDIEGEGRNPTRGHVIRLGRRHGYGEKAVDAMIEEVRAAVWNWTAFAETAGVSRASKSDIGAALETVGSRFFEG